MKKKEWEKLQQLTVEELVAVKNLTGFITLNNNYRNSFNHLMCGKAFAASQALSSSADALAVLGVAGIHDLALLIPTIRTFHGMFLPAL